MSHVHSWPVVTCDRCDMTLKERIEELRVAGEPPARQPGGPFLPLTPGEVVALDALRLLKAIEWIKEEPSRGAGGAWRYCPSCGNVGAHSYDACALASVMWALEHNLSGGAWPSGCAP